MLSTEHVVEGFHATTFQPMPLVTEDKRGSQCHQVKDLPSLASTTSRPIRTICHASSERDNSDADNKLMEATENDPTIAGNQQDPPPQSLNNSDTPTSTAPSFPFLPTAIATLAFVLFWPFLAFLRSLYYNVDVDMFMALKGILDTPLLPSDTAEIVELPPLSPAERLVDAIFGPPPPPPH
jgi:hypothetical protein